MEYTGTYQNQMEQYKRAMEEYIAKRNHAMAEAGVYTPLSPLTGKGNMNLFRTMAFQE